MKKLKPHIVDWAQIERFLASADKKLASAQKILAFPRDPGLGGRPEIQPPPK
jgi:hypothetical protein